MQVNVTDYERIAIILTNKLGQAKCPKCKGICNQNCTLKEIREWNCQKCGRGWQEIPSGIQTLKQLWDLVL